MGLLGAHNCALHAQCLLVWRIHIEGGVEATLSALKFADVPTLAQTQFQLSSSFRLCCDACAMRTLPGKGRR